LSSAFTPVNALGNCVATIAVAKWDHAVDTAKLHAEVGVGAVLSAKPRPAE
jgi:Na+/H+-dicarboxylate symporter